MSKVLNNTQLKAKMYEVLLCLYTKHSGVTFHVYDERRDVDKSNRILIRSSIMKPVKGKEWGEEFASIDYLDATSDTLIADTNALGDEVEAARKKILES